MSSTFTLVPDSRLRVLLNVFGAITILNVAEPSYTVAPTTAAE